MFIALERDNLQFVRYFASIIPSPELTPTHLFILAITNHCNRSVLEYLALSVPAANFTVDLLVECIHAANVVALNVVYKFVPQPLSPINAQQLVAHASTSTGECMEWLSIHNLIVYDESMWEYVFAAYSRNSDSLIDWFRGKGFAFVCSRTDLVDLTDYMTVALGFDCLHQLLVDNTVEDLYRVAPYKCVLAVLASGNLVWCRQLRATWFCGASNSLVYSVYRTAMNSGPDILNYLAERVPLSLEMMGGLLSCLCINHSAGVFAWFIRHVQIPQITSFVEKFAVMAATTSSIEHLDLFAKLETNPLFWYKLSSRIRFNSLDVVDWFAAQCWYWPKMFAELPNYRKILSLVYLGATNDDVPGLLRVFDRAPASVCMSLPPEMAKTTRLWWQYQRAKIGLLITATRRLRVQSLPPELWHLIAAEYLSGL